MTSPESFELVFFLRRLDTFIVLSRLAKRSYRVTARQEALQDLSEIGRHFSSIASLSCQFQTLYINFCAARTKLTSYFHQYNRFLPQLLPNILLNLVTLYKYCALHTLKQLNIEQVYLFCFEIWFPSHKYALFWVVSFHFSLSSI